MYECKIAETLVRLRTAKGVTQEEVAAALSVSNKTISKWENGASAPDLGMLVALAQYYEISTDALLGLAKEKTQNVRDVVKNELDGLGRTDVILKAFDLTRAIIPTSYDIIGIRSPHTDHTAGALPAAIEDGRRNHISTTDFFNHTVSNDDINASVMLLRNKSNFAWLKDPNKQKKMAALFRFLSDTDALSCFYFISSEACSESFTADYIAQNAGVPEEKVTQILDEFCRVGRCYRTTAHLKEGTVAVYKSSGAALMLSIIALAYEQTCSDHCYNYNYSGSGKMIGGD